ncbi:MAG TPA: hypothetical protein VKS60_08490 [Stellaceae bacterium]|nr:hypothetical protein [Stellaceae bacterium]
MLELVVGCAAALVIGGLAWLTVATAATPEAADTSIRTFGTLMTILFGILSAIWWHQSARLCDRLLDRESDARQSQKDANTLNAAAATFTALAVFSGVFAGAPWQSTSSRLCGLGVLLLLTMSGDDIRRAVPISLRQRLTLREIIGLASLALVLVAFLWQLKR